MAESEHGPQAVGYKRPPRASRFKPGQSGNPKGRPKGSKNIGTAIQEELDATIIATENGKRHRMPKRRAMIKRLMNQALAGDMKAIALLLAELRQYEVQPAAAPAETVFDTVDDEKVIEGIKQRIVEAALEEAKSKASEEGAEQTLQIRPSDPGGNK